MEWKPLIVCDTGCNFEDLIELVNNLIHDLVLLSIILATAAFIWIGLKLLTSGGNESALKESKEMAWKVLKGFLWILVAWLLIYTISTTLLEPGYDLLGEPK